MTNLGVFLIEYLNIKYSLIFFFMEKGLHLMSCWWKYTLIFFR